MEATDGSNRECMCRLCAKRKEEVKGMQLEEQVMAAVCHAVSAGYANMVRRADGLQNAAGLFEGLHNMHNKCNPKQYCSSKRLRTLQGAIKQIEGLDGLSGKCTAQLKRLRNLLAMGKAKDGAQTKDGQGQGDSSKVKVKRKRDKDSLGSTNKEKKTKKQKDLALE